YFRQGLGQVQDPIRLVQGAQCTQGQQIGRRQIRNGGDADLRLSELRADLQGGCQQGRGLVCPAGGKQRLRLAVQQPVEEAAPGVHVGKRQLDIAPVARGQLGKQA